VAPDDVNNPTSFRLSIRKLEDVNQSFPRETDEGFYEAMKTGSSEVAGGSIPFPCDYAARARATVGNPVAAVLEYKTMIGNVLKELFGAEPNHYGHRKTTNRTSYYGDRIKGLFGDVLAFYGMTEAQARGSLHYHCLVWGSISPKLLQGGAHIEEVCNEIGLSLDNMYSAELPREAHVYNSITTCMRRNQLFRKDVKRHYGILEVPPSLVEDSEGYHHHVCANCLCTNMHTHSFTCHKPPTGHDGCRMNYPCEHCEKTCPVQLSKDAEDENGVPVVLDKIEDPPLRIDLSDTGNPLQPKDRRLIAWELKRTKIEKLESIEADPSGKEFYYAVLKDALGTYPGNGAVLRFLQQLNSDEIKSVYEYVNENLEGANKNVVAYNPALTACLGCNTAAYFLGNTTQSNSSIYYICPYIAKDKASADTVITTFEKAVNDVVRHPSTAEDTGTPLRTVTHLLQRVTNSLSRKVEITDTQAVACLLGMGPELTSEKFVYFGPNQAANYAIAGQIERRQRDPNSTGTSSDSYDDDSDDDDSDYSCPVTEDDREEDWDDTDLEGYAEAGAAPPYGTENDNEPEDHDTESEDHNREQVNPSMLSRDYKKWNLGATGTYKIDNGETNTSEPVRYNDHFGFRGEGLRHLTRLEYNAVVGIRKNGKQVPSAVLGEEKRKQPGHVANGRFPFDKGHKLYASHEQQLLSKQCVVIFTGREPKLPSAAHKNSRQERIAFARYYLATFRSLEKLLELCLIIPVRCQVDSKSAAGIGDR
jgi:hypothetical protein